ARRLQIAMAVDAGGVGGLHELHATAVFLMARGAAGRRRLIGGVDRSVVTREAGAIAGVRPERIRSAGRPLIRLTRRSRVAGFALRLGERVCARHRPRAVRLAAAGPGEDGDPQPGPSRGGERQPEPPPAHALRAPEVVEVDPLRECFCCAYAHLLDRGASPLGLPYTLSRAPLRRRAPFAWLTRCARSLLTLRLGVSYTLSRAPLRPA